MVDEPQFEPLVRVQQHNIALTFVNHLKRLAIAAQVRTDEGSFIIYCQQDKFAQAQTEFEVFSREPYHPRYQENNWQFGQGEQSLERSNEASTLVKSFLAHGGAVTLIVFALSWLIFIAAKLGWAMSLFNQLRFYEFVSLAALAAEPWRLVGPAFFHFSWLHIVFNTMWWWQLGGDIEKKLGWPTLATVLLLSAILSNLGQFIVTGANFGGLSGVVYALVGFIWWYGWLAPERGLMLPKPLIGFMLFWLLLGYTSLSPVNMANTAHLVGLLTGCLFAWLALKLKAS
jgi:GlpG protein